MKIRKLRTDQKEAIRACQDAPQGQIIEPTGCGKTVVALHVVSKTAEEKNKQNQSFIAVVFVHRILLAKQWIKSSGEFLIEQKQLKFHFLNINSGGLSRTIKNDIEDAQYDLDGAGVIPILSTTNATEIKERVDHLLNQGYNVLITCTYHSAEALVNANLPINIAIHDECQTLPNNREFRKCLDLVADKKLFFTATPTVTASDEGWGLNNPERYGPIIYEMKPKEAIKIGAIVGPEIHLVGTEWAPDQSDEGELRERDFNLLTDMIYFAHSRHKKYVLQQSANQKRIGAKLLVVCNGQLELHGIFESKSFRKLKAEHPNIKIFGLSSDFGIYMNGQRVEPPVSTSNKEDFLYALLNLDVTEDCIIFHVDMLAEGLDVPSITGVMPLRNFSSQMKFLQNVGRATRLHPDDQLSIEIGAVKPGNWSKYIKPCCHVLLPSCLKDNRDFVERYALILDGLRSHYDFDPSERIVVDILNPNQQGPDWDEDKLAREIRSLIRTDIKNFYHSREQENMQLQEVLLVHKFLRFITDDDETTMIKLMAPRS